jgi:hypothetical protein
VSEKDKDVKKRVVIMGYDPRFPKDEYTGPYGLGAHKIEVVLYKNGAIALSEVGTGEGVIYLYKSQRKELEKLLGTAKRARREAISEVYFEFGWRLTEAQKERLWRMRK